MDDGVKRFLLWLKRASRPLFVLAVLLALVALVWHYRDPLVQLERSARQALLPQARIMLQVERDTAAADPGAPDVVTALKISGKVQAFGAPVTSGVLHVVVEDIVSQHYLAGRVVDVVNGDFREIALAIPKTGKTHGAVQVKATFRGRTRVGGVDVHVEGETNTNLGFPRRFETISAWAIAAVGIAFALVLIALFTGAMNTRKQRSLYSVMYLIVFISLVLPIIVSVMLLQSSYLVAIMEKAPIGLVRATSASSKTELQWFLNIGGVVTSRDETSQSPRSGATTGEAAKSGDNAAAAAADKASAPSTSASPPARGTARAASERPDQNSVSSVSRSSPYIEGGLAVPFYVILLAMFGAGINLTRRVPEIQEEYSGTVPRARPLSDWLFPPENDNDVIDVEQQRQTFAFRRALIQNYMYVLSAPFLATAVYYLLQVVATEPARPILVLVSFATGLISDTLVNRIVRFAEENLKLCPANKAEAARELANARISNINAAMLQESAKAHEAHYMAQISCHRRQLEATLKDRPDAVLPDVPEFKSLPLIPPVAAAGSKSAKAADGSAPDDPAKPPDEPPGKQHS